MSATHRRCRWRPIGARHFGEIVVALAVALTGAAITAPGASAATPCVYQYFGLSNTYQPCVLDEQVLLNDLYYVGDTGPGGPNQLLLTDGYYGSHMASDVGSFNRGIGGGDVTTPRTWKYLCSNDVYYGFHGSYWHAAGCPLVSG